MAYHAEPHQITLHEVERLFVAVRLATVQQYLRAATIFGLADRAHSQIHDAIVGPRRGLVDAALALVRGVLEPAVFTDAFTAGQRLSLGEAFTTLLGPDYANEDGYRAVAT